MRIFSDSFEEVSTPKKLNVIGKIPSTLVGGTLLRNGPAVFGAQGKNKRRYTHVFDGLGKISR
jgi:carotenoid cleavage dioxygenase-like enzyme